MKPFILVILSLFFLLAACSPAGNEESAADLPTRSATATAAPDALSEAAAVVEVTAVPPTSTPAPQPTEPPTATPLPTETPRPATHTIQDGESLISIAALYDTTVEAIALANDLIDINLVYAGQELTIPSSTGELPAVNEAQSDVVAGEAVETAVSPSPTPFTAADLGGDAPASIGSSVLGRSIDLYTFGDGPQTVVFVGGIHGGYEWNSTVLAYEAIDYFTQNPDDVPTAVTLHIIPAANPDGIYDVTYKTGPITTADIVVADTFPARFNANDVDLNRNWDCQWSPTALWRDQEISGGSAPFSEIENQALRAFLEQQTNLKVVLFWHSAANMVSPGGCGRDHQPSIDLAGVFARAAGYPVRDFAAYDITGDASDWLTTIGIPSFTVELINHQETDWNQNLAGMLALLSHFND